MQEGTACSILVLEPPPPAQAANPAYPTTLPPRFVTLILLTKGVVTQARQRQIFDAGVKMRGASNLFNITPNGEHQKNSPVPSWRRVKILTPRRLCENPNKDYVTHGTSTLNQVSDFCVCCGPHFHFHLFSTWFPQHLRPPTHEKTTAFSPNNKQASTYEHFIVD